MKKSGFLYRVGWLLCFIIFYLFYRHKVYGKEHLPKDGGIIAANHLSFLDPPLLGISVFEPICFLARHSLFKPPILSRLLPKLNTFPVKVTVEEDGTRVTRLDASILRILCQKIKEGQKVVVFPEGSRSLDGTLQPIKPGIGMMARLANCPIIPTYIEGTFEVWNKDRKFPKLWGKTSCHFGKPIQWSEFSHLDKKEAEKAIAERLWEELQALQTQALKDKV